LSATLENLDPHITYFLAVRSYSLSGVQSDASEELVWAYDADGDDMPDGWEICHFGEGGGPNTGRDDDYDGDGMLNIQEFVAGTDPVNPTDAAGLRIEMKNGQIIASFGTIEADGPGCAGLSRTYTLEESTNLLAGAWQPVSGCENMPASGSVIEVPLAAPGARPRFFRTQVRLQ
jgi:hypothetical protein